MCKTENRKIICGEKTTRGQGRFPTSGERQEGRGDRGALGSPIAGRGGAPRPVSLGRGRGAGSPQRAPGVAPLRPCSPGGKGFNGGSVNSL